MHLAETRPERRAEVARARAFAEPLLQGELLDTGEAVLAHADGVAVILSGIGAAPALQDLVLEPCFRSERALITPKGHPLAQAPLDHLGQIAAYPLTTCTVSGDKLGGSMGPAQGYVWRVAGQPDRLVRFCCNDCLDDFQKTPAKFLAMIDTAKAKK